MWCAIRVMDGDNWFETVTRSVSDRDFTCRYNYHRYKVMFSREGVGQIQIREPLFKESYK